jgi:hypothetical protein
MIYLLKLIMLIMLHVLKESVLMVMTNKIATVSDILGHFLCAILLFVFLTIYDESLNHTSVPPPPT